MSEQTSDQLLSFDPEQSRVDVKARRRYVLTADARGKSDGAYHTDLAKMLAQHCRKRLRYVGKQWARFDGQRWVIDGEDVAAYREWQELRPRIQFEFTDDEGKKHTKPISASLAMTRGVVASARNLLRLHQGDFDQRAHELNTPTGIVYLKKGVHGGHKSSRMHSRITQVAPDFDAPAPARFLDFLETIMLSDKVQEEYLLAVLALCLLGEPGGQYLHILLGEGGNGKGVLFNILQGLLGVGGAQGSGYYIELEGTFFTTTRNPKHESEEANLHGARVVVLSEFPAKSTWRVTRLKNFTGDNSITASFKYQPQFTFKPAATFLANSNTIPDTAEINKAMKRRLRGIPFEYTHEGQQNDNLHKQIVAAEGPAIMALLCKKAKEFLANGSRMPPQSARMVDQMAMYLEEQDTTGEFMGECCMAKDGAATLNTEIYQAYQFWCGSQGIAKHDQVTRNTLMGEIRKRGYKIDYTRRDPDTGDQDGRRRTRGLALAKGARSGVLVNGT